MNKNQFNKKINSPFLLKIPYKNNSIIFFNRTNGAIFVIRKSELDSLLSAEKDYLKIYEEIVESKIFDFDEIVLHKTTDNFVVTIELSTMCNLNCLYCYQHDFVSRKEISDDILGLTFHYVEQVFRKNPNQKYVVIGIIGGEPLIHFKKVIYIIEKIKELTHKINKKAYFHIDTNGTIDFSSIFNSYDNLQVSVSLTNKSDHNVNRSSNKFDSFEKITENLKKCNNKKNRLCIRYNTNHNNIKEFKTFVKYIRHNFPNVYNIDAMYTDNYEFNNRFLNELSIKDFTRWNSTEAIDILIKNGYPITGMIPSVLQLCSAYQQYSCKVHADGYISLCDAMNNSKILNIKDLCTDINLLHKKFLKYKNYNPLKDFLCKTCSKVIQCQGRLFCRTTNKCNYQKRYDEKLFISKFVEYSNLNKEKYFTGM